MHYLLPVQCAFQQLHVSSKALFSGTRVKGSLLVTPPSPALFAQTHHRAAPPAESSILTFPTERAASQLDCASLSLRI